MVSTRNYHLALSEFITIFTTSVSLIALVLTVNLNHDYSTIRLLFMTFVTLFVFTIGLNIHVKIGDPNPYLQRIIINATIVEKTLGKTILGATIYPSLTITFLSFVAQTLILEKTPLELMEVRGVELAVLTSTLLYSTLLFTLTLVLRSLYVSLCLTLLTAFMVTFLDVKPINQIDIILNISTSCILTNIALTLLLNLVVFIYVKLVKPI